MDQKNQRPGQNPGAVSRNTARLGKTEPSYFNNFAQPSKPDANATTLRAIDCPKFDKCSVPICPLDCDFHERTHLKGEPICRYLHEYVKPGGKVVLRGSLPEAIVDRVVQVYPEIITRYRPINWKLREESAKEPSKIRRLRRVADAA